MHKCKCNRVSENERYCNCESDLSDTTDEEYIFYQMHHDNDFGVDDREVCKDTMTVNERDPRYNYEQFRANNEESTAFLYLVKSDDHYILGSSGDISKDLEELSSEVGNIDIVKVLQSDPLFITYSETLILNTILHDNKHFSGEYYSQVLGVMDNLSTWLSLNGYMEKYSELSEEFIIHEVDVDGEGAKDESDQDLVVDVIDTYKSLLCEFEDSKRLLELSDGLVTHNCRLRLDTRELVNNSGGLFGSGDSTGSIGVVTLNLAKIGFISNLLSYDIDSLDETQREDYEKIQLLLKNYPELEARVFNLVRRLVTPSNGGELSTKKSIYFMIIEYFMDLARKSLLIKRKVCQDYMDNGLTPYTRRYIGTLERHFNTLGVNGGHEMCLNMLGEGIQTDEGLALSEETLRFMLERLSDYQDEDTGLLYNLEATPAEGAGTRFAKTDRKHFNTVITGAGTNAEFYTNSTQLPEDFSDNIFEVFEHQQYLQPLYTSGTVQHIYMNEPTHNWRVVQSLVKNLFTNYKLPYISISPDVCICRICGRLNETHEYCPNDHTEEQIQSLRDKGIDSVIVED